jgi:hypothetical protein
MLASEAQDARPEARGRGEAAYLRFKVLRLILVSG